MADLNGTDPTRPEAAETESEARDLDAPSDAVRAEIDPALAIEGDEVLVFRTADEALGAAVRWIDAGHATTGDPPATVTLGPGTVDRAGHTVREVVVDGWRFVVRTQPERAARLRAWAARGREAAGHAGPTEVRAIIPGRVVAVTVAVGDTVEAGQQLLVVEAMKMQNELRAPRAGTVERVSVGPGQTVDIGTVLVVIG